MDKTKIIALYLPQFHRIPENDKFWGEGFTDWVTVKKAKPLFEGHQQPRVPLNDNYYDLSQKENVGWQARLAKENGIYGFGIYHYWFNNEQNLLTKPAEIIRDNDDIDINYCFVWDNGNWIRSWSSFDVKGNDWAPTMECNVERKGPEILINYVLGTETDWEQHYRYVFTHFKKRKYIKIDNKPVFGIINPSPEILQMCKFWNSLAIKDGFEGITFIFRNKGNEIPLGYFSYNYEPHTAGLEKNGLVQKIEKRVRRFLHQEEHVTVFDFDVLWHNLLKNAEKSNDKSVYFGAFVGYDDTPRRGKIRGKIVKYNTPEKFQKYLLKLLDISREKNKDFVFLSAWNEWGEGMYLEPDKTNGFAYLEAIKICMDKSNI